MRDVIEAKYLTNLPYILGAFALVLCSGGLAFGVYAEKASRPASGPLYDSAFVVVFESEGCGLCDQFRSTIARQYSSTPTASKAGLRYIDVTDGAPPSRYKLKRDVNGAPNIVVFDVYGREEGRINGMPKSLSALEDMVASALRRGDREIERTRR